MQSMYFRTLATLATVVAPLSLLHASTAFTDFDLRSVTGTFADNRIGWSVALGDLNGDGYADLLTGGPDTVVGAAFVGGRVRAYSGATGGLLLDITAGGDAAYFGASVAVIGDVNGDGGEDFIVGAENDKNINGQNSGTARVYSGKTGAGLWSFLDQNAGDKNGGFVASVGDVNGDGVRDFAIGAQGNDQNGADSGAARILSGATFGLIRWHFGNAGSWFGAAISEIGDVNGDGRSDYAVAGHLDATAGSMAGRVVVYSGINGVMLWSKQGVANELFGRNLAKAGDVDGDGVPDLLVSSTAGPAGSSGAVYVLKGNNGAIIRTHLGVIGSSGNMAGPVGLGDLNGDGRAEYAYRATYQSAPLTYVTSIRVHDGATGNSLGVIDPGTQTPALGISIASGRDMNGDGYFDLALGDSNVNSPFPGCGAAHVYSTVGGSISPISLNAGCPGTGGFTPKWTVGKACMSPLGKFSLTFSDGFGGQPALFFLSASASALNYKGCLIEAFPVASILTIPQAGAGPGAGTVPFAGTLPLGIPNATIYLQGFSIDPIVPRGFSSSPGLKIVTQ